MPKHEPLQRRPTPLPDGKQPPMKEALESERESGASPARPTDSARIPPMPGPVTVRVVDGYKIERGIPLPKRRGPIPLELPLGALDVGESFLVSDHKAFLSRFKAKCLLFAPARFRQQKEAGGIRIFRVK